MVRLPSTCCTGTSAPAPGAEKRLCPAAGVPKRPPGEVLKPKPVEVPAAGANEAVVAPKRPGLDDAPKPCTATGGVERELIILLSLRPSRNRKRKKHF